MKVAKTKNDAPKFSGPLFITGIWRSGSSLLYALLNKHPRVGLMYEADLTLLREAFWLPTRRTWAQRWESWNAAVSRHGFDTAPLQQAGGSFRRAVEFTHKEYARRKGADIWGDKSPDLHDRLVPLAGDFPGARFIVVWRQPEATIASMQVAASKGARFFQKRGMALRGLIGNRVLRRQCDHLIELGVPVLEIDYENLVADTDKVMHRVCAFLDIPFESRVVSLEGANRESMHAGEHHSLVRGDKILSKRRTTALPEKAQQKIQRYVNHWSKCHDGKWPRPDFAAVATSRAAGLAERCGDLILYRAFRCLDASKRLAFCWMPLKLVIRHREQKGHG
jgi:Sulfotransferase family